MELFLPDLTTWSLAAGIRIPNSLMQGEYSDLSLAVSVNTIVRSMIFSSLTENGDVCKQPCQLRSDGGFRCSSNITINVEIEKCTSLKHYDYFTGSGAAFVLTFVGLGLCVPGMNSELFKNGNKIRAFTYHSISRQFSTIPYLEKVFFIRPSRLAFMSRLFLFEFQGPSEL